MHFFKILPTAVVLLGLGTQLSESALAKPLPWSIAQLSTKQFSNVQPASLTNSGELVDSDTDLTPFSTVVPAMLTDEGTLSTPIQPASSVRPNALVGEGTLDDSEQQPKLDNGLRFDHYKFEGETGEQITITGESSDFDITVSLFLIGEEGLEEIAINDNASDTTTNAKIETTLSITGTYVIIVGPATTDGQGEYVLTLDGTGES